MGSVFGPIRFLLPVCRFCWFYIHLYMYIFRCIFLSNYWWQESDIWSQASYRYAILWGAFLDPSDSYFLFAEERGYHKWALAHSSSCSNCFDSHIGCSDLQGSIRNGFNVLPAVLHVLVGSVVPIKYWPFATMFSYILCTRTLLGTDHLTCRGGRRFWFFVSFRKFFSDNTRVRIFIFFVAKFFSRI